MKRSMVMEALQDGKAEAAAADKPLFGVLAHGYQPPRLFRVELETGGKPYQAEYSVIPQINQVITDQVYRPILGEVEHLPPGLVTSIYAPLRSYLKKNNPELFEKIRSAARQTPDREYKVLGDPLVHVILPLLPGEDQRMLLEAGRRAFEADFGFSPKGLWLPETGVSRETLRLIREAGYEFVPLRDNQVTNIPGNVRLDARHNVCFIDVGNGAEIAVLLGNSGLSAFVSYTQSSTYNAEAFMEWRRSIEQQNGSNALMIMDLERFGHHQIGAEEFLKRILSIQEQYGFAPLDMQRILREFQTGKREKTYVDVAENSSWSCPHELGRWTGTCSCGEFGEAPPSVIADRKMLYENLRNMNAWVNARLDESMPEWRKVYADFLVEWRDAIFNGENFGPAVRDMFAGHPQGDLFTRLFVAKTEVLVGFTSCGWFFGEENRCERAIPASMIAGVSGLFPEETFS